MKKTATILLLVFAFTFTTQAQKKGEKPSVDKMLKKMTKNLNLTEAQQSKIKPLLVEQFADRKALKEDRDALKASGEKPTKEMRKKMRSEKIAKETTMNTKMASILDKEQFAKFEAMAKERKEKAKNKFKKKKQ